jgi:hypothetical protein
MLKIFNFLIEILKENYNIDIFTINESVVKSYMKLSIRGKLKLLKNKKSTSLILYENLIISYVNTKYLIHQERKKNDILYTLIYHIIHDYKKKK